jgi:energy-coupling factor transporter transmembrane protein EcfT
MTSEGPTPVPNTSKISQLPLYVSSCCKTQLVQFIFKILCITSIIIFSICFVYGVGYVFVRYVIGISNMNLFFYIMFIPVMGIAVIIVFIFSCYVLIVILDFIRGALTQLYDKLKGYWGTFHVEIQTDMNQQIGYVPPSIIPEV